MKIPGAQHLVSMAAKHSLPRAVIIEPTTRCNLRCWGCLRNTLTRPIQDMTMQNYDDVLNSIPSIMKVDLFFMGEPMLHPKLWNMIEVTKERRIKTHIATNSTFINKNLDSLIHSPLSSLSISLDGLTPETMTLYRMGSDCQETLDGIIQYLKAPKTTEVTIRFLVFKHNEHEIPNVMDLCRQYDVPLHLVAPILDWGYAKLPKNRKQFMSSLPQFQRYDADGLVKKPQFCGHEWKPVISVSGDVLPCCYDVNGSYKLGNLFETDFYNIFWSKTYRQLREKMNRRALALCKTCKHTKHPYVVIKP